MNLWHRLLESSRGILHNMSEETNIIGKFDEHIILTKDGNLSTLLQLQGVSYSSYSLDEQERFLNTRNTFFKSIPPTFSISVFQKRQPISFSSSTDLTNLYAKEIMEKWEADREVFETKYYVCLTTKANSLATKLEKKRASLTSSKQVVSNFDYLKNQTEEVVKEIKSNLKEYGVYQLKADEALSFFASYANMEETTVGLKSGLLQDHYISANVSFKKDYIKHEGAKETYTRFLSVKAYDTEQINSDLTKNLLSIRKSLMVCEQLQNISKDKALSKIKDKIRLSNDIVQGELSALYQLVESDRETMVYYSLSVMVNASSLGELEQLCIDIKQLFGRYGIVAVIENINLKPLYFSFFPAKDRLNSRKRIITSMNVSTLNFFEKDVVGFEKNSWGHAPLSVFQTPTGALHFFNLHHSPSQNALGHTIIIAEAGSGKTTFVSFLMACMEKYGILRLGLDKLKGMYCMCNYLDGKYGDMDTMQLNPFSLKPDAENMAFLENFLFRMGEIKDTDHAEIQAVRDTLEQLYGMNATATLTDFIESLPKLEGLAQRYLRYQDSIFDNEQCLLDFQNTMNVLGMDTILKDQKLSGLTAFYVFHKLKRIAEEKQKGFFVFIDELKDYINNQEMSKLILERILEARKSNGVMTVAVQNIDFFVNLENRDSFLDGFAHYIIFPTKSQESLKKLKEQLALNEAELEFLRSTDPKKHHVLFKNRKSQESIVLDISLKRLGEHLGVFDSSIQSVQRMQHLIEENPQTWRKEFLG
ncbi:hypothetical protein JWV37_10785 [Sulfurospirillum sp. T05]|uniref:CagE TrbE VirB component of type IV transporter system central domain-containing protein n=1 Tax=Sulfurospirillum tamanense TaxID=2813362 RepID=A0ABS2WUD4_9BACT|nr:hypothetical protein [Sulfurospirillum tamanensis]MBN2965268.1 hypothetical protein [Sulfurospirillum tamanensis]